MQRFPATRYRAFGKNVPLATALVVLVVGCGPPPGAGTATAELPPPLPLETFLAVLEGENAAGQEALDQIENAWRPGSAPMLLEILRWKYETPVGNRIQSILVDKLGLRSFNENAVRQRIWAVESDPHPRYDEFKGQVLTRVDPRFVEHFPSGVPTTIRLDQIEWGGVRRDGIPPLRNPEMVSAGDADWLDDDHVVFGIEINGDARAYPKRILAWHEMFCDTVGDVPVAGVYCTLCGTMIVYDCRWQDATYDLGTSGLLYQSNKLMYDQQTLSLWSTLTGQPVVGSLVGKQIALPRFPVVTTTWGQWRTLHPASRVLSLNTGQQRDYSEGAAYRDYFATDDLMFQVPRLDNRLANKEEVLALRSDDGSEAVAFAAGFLRDNPVYHDRFQNESIVILTDASGANRAYESGSIEFVEWDQRDVATDSTGRKWTVTETELVADNDQSNPPQDPLTRIPSHRAFWFGWYSAYPETRLVR